MFPFFSVDFAELNPGSDIIKYKDESIEVVIAHMYCEVTGIVEASVVNTMLAYPNPVIDHFTLDCTGLEIREILIYDCIGQLVALKIPEADCACDVANLDRGIYWVRIMTAGRGVYTTRIIKL